MPNSPLTVTVSQLGRKIASMIRSEKTFEDLCVKGEISNFSPNARSGHIYFTLKDDTASIRVVIFRNTAEYINAALEDGMAVVVRGTVKCYEAGGYYQIVAADVRPDGEGALAAQFAMIKAKLEAEGLFKQKRPLPEMPRKICVITSESGAVLHDILQNIESRCPEVRIVFIPAAVQGEYAPASLVSALGKANETDADLIIFGRGGGSAEDLSAFNDEGLARAIFASRIPTISAVGHETDFTIADFVADERASTPTKAAQIAVPDMRELVSKLVERKNVIRTSLHRVFENKVVAVTMTDTKIKAKSPMHRLAANEQKLAPAADKLAAQMKRIIEERSRQYEDIYSDVKLRAGRIVENKETALMHTASVIKLLDPLAILMRGYSITYKDGKALVNADDVSAGDRIKIKLSGGSISAVVESTEKDIRYEI